MPGPEPEAGGELQAPQDQEGGGGQAGQATWVMGLQLFPKKLHAKKAYTELKKR